MLDPVSCCTLPHIMKPAGLTGLHDLSLKFAKFHHSAQMGCVSFVAENILDSVYGGTGTHVRPCVGVIVSDERASLLKSRWLFWCPIGWFFVAIKPSFTAIKQIANPKMTPVINESLWVCSVWAAHSGERCARSEVCAQTCLLARVNLCSVTDEAKQYFVTMLLWLDSDQTHFDFSLFFFLLWWNNYISGCGLVCVRRAKSKDPLCRTESWLWGIGLRMSCEVLDWECPALSAAAPR